MSRGYSFLQVVALTACGLLAVGCLSRKKDQASVEEAAAPPPAGYPDGPTEYGSSTAGTSAAPPAPRSSTPAPASEPAPFELRSNEELVTHRIESGESLSSISSKYGTSISRIQAANKMSGTTIYAGKTLQVPTRKSSSVTSTGAGAPTPPTPASTGSYSSSAPPPSSSGAASSSGGGRFGSTATPQYQGPAGQSGTTEVARRDSDPSSTSYSRSSAPPAPPDPEEFPTPSFGGSRIQFSD